MYEKSHNELIFYAQRHSMSQTIGRDEEAGFLSSLGVLCLAADGRWAVKRPGTNGLDGPFKA